MQGVEFVRFIANKLPTVDNKTRGILFQALTKHLIDFIECHEEHMADANQPLSVIDLAAHSVGHHKCEEALELLIGLFQKDVENVHLFYYMTMKLTDHCKNVNFVEFSIGLQFLSCYINNYFNKVETELKPDRYEFLEKMCDQAETLL